MSRRRRKEAFFGKKVNLGGGRFLDQKTGRIYVDSHDMDGWLDSAWERWQNPDSSEAGHEPREMPPAEFRRLAMQEEARMAARARGEALEAAAQSVRGRLETVRAKVAWRKSQGLEPDVEDLDEIKSLEILLDPKRRRKKLGKEIAKRYAWLDQ